MTKYIIDEKGLEVISEIHDKDFKSKKEEEQEEASKDKSDEEKKQDEKSDEVEFEDI